MLGEGTELRNTITFKPYAISPVYAECRRNEKTYINYSNFDIAKKKNRQITVAYPIVINGKFRGGILFENDQVRTFEEVIIPSSFKPKKFPFVQFRKPEYPQFTRFIPDINSLTQE